MNVQPGLNTSPRDHSLTSDRFVLATDACFDCALACRTCADACLDEERLNGLRNCIEMYLDCADVCFATGDLAIRRLSPRGSRVAGRTGLDETIMELMFDTCAEVCRCCADKCLQHAKHNEHRRRCAEACRCCAQACRDAARAAMVH